MSTMLQRSLTRAARCRQGHIAPASRPLLAAKTVRRSAVPAPVPVRCVATRSRQHTVPRRFSTAKAATSAPVVPVIDLGPLRGAHGAEAKTKLAQQIGDACERIGFFTLTNHGVPAELSQDMFAVTNEFFDLPLDKKQKIKMTEEYPYGYNGYMAEKLGKGFGEQDAPPDLKECFAIGPYNPAAGMPSVLLPDEPARMSRVYTSYYQAMEGLARDVLGLFAVALELPQNWFDDKIDHHRSALRALNYPELQADSAKAGQMRAGAHTDYGSLTILAQDSTGGLQVVPRDGGWADVPYVQGSFIVNIGDLMALWTNDKWVSTIHRVKPSLPRRTSVAFFHNINHDHMVECIDTCKSDTNPPKYKPILAWDHLMQKHLESVEQGKSYK